MASLIEQLRAKSMSGGGSTPQSRPAPAVQLPAPSTRPVASISRTTTVVSSPARPMANPPRTATSVVRRPAAPVAVRQQQSLAPAGRGNGAVATVPRLQPPVRLPQYQNSDYSDEEDDLSAEEEEEITSGTKQRTRRRRKNPGTGNIINYGTMSDVANDYGGSNVVKGNVNYTYHYGATPFQR